MIPRVSGLGGTLLMACAVALPLSLATPLTAQATPMNSWEHHCVVQDDNGEKVCTTELRSQDQETEAIFYFARGPRGPVPFVAHSENQSFGALSVSVDEQDPIEADSCIDGICYFEADKSNQLLRQFRRGRAARVTIQDRQGQQLFDSEITLMGFSAAYKLY